jgi:hypothetical protein
VIVTVPSRTRMALCICFQRVSRRYIAGWRGSSENPAFFYRCIKESNVDPAEVAKNGRFLRHGYPPFGSYDPHSLSTAPASTWLQCMVDPRGSGGRSQGRMQSRARCDSAYGLSCPGRGSRPPGCLVLLPPLLHLPMGVAYAPVCRQKTGHLPRKLGTRSRHCLGPEGGAGSSREDFYASPPHGSDG